MLGTVNALKHWVWFAWGKHPVARDYFRVGPEEPIFVAFSEWVQKGYLHLTNQKNIDEESCSFRFWAKGSRKGTLACGLAKTSSDSVGRRYPFLVMGTGALDKWNKHWELLPVALDQTWNQMEFLSSRRFADFGDLEEEVGTIRMPANDWADLVSRRTSPGPWMDRWEKSYFSNLFRAGAREDMCIVPLDHGNAHEPAASILAWHAFLKEHTDIPNALFIGGTPRKSYLVAYKRPLGTSDFVHLWSLDKIGPS